MENGRCRMHGGKSTGAPTGKDNGNYKHGKRTQQRMQERREIKALCHEARTATRATNRLLYRFKLEARNLGLRWQKLWQLCTQDDGGVELVQVIATRLSKLANSNYQG